jgi:hypothetical protein
MNIQKVFPATFALSSRGATVESSQTRSVWFRMKKYFVLKGQWNSGKVSAVPPGRDKFYLIFPDTSCLATFRLWLRHNQPKRTPDKISRLAIP